MSFFSIEQIKELFEEFDIIYISEKEYDKNAKTNYQEAVAAAKKIKTKMKIVPVRTFDDAVRYLEKNKINMEMK